MIEIDGSYGEGGGQIVRTALALSCLTQKPFEVTNIRKGRCKGGLKAQHLHCVKGLEQLCSARTEGAEKGSERLYFEPGKMAARHLDIDVGTAGSITLVLQSLLLPAYFADRTTKIRLTGGSDTKWSMPVDYLKEVLLPQLRRYCESVELKVLKRGYYPAGGGVVEIAIKPKYKLSGYFNFDGFLAAFRKDAPKINLLEQGKLMMIKGVSHASKNLESKKVAERQADAAKQLLASYKVPVDIAMEYCDTLSAGSGITLWAMFSRDRVETDPLNPIVLGADGLGERGKSAEQVGIEAAKGIVEQIDSGAPVDEHLVDNLIPWMALASGSKIKAAKLTKHALTNIYVVEKFLGKIFKVDEQEKTIESL
jgi:RNA 3'-terminal phosphate cyclase (GTP)